MSNKSEKFIIWVLSIIGLIALLTGLFSHFTASFIITGVFWITALVLLLRLRLKKAKLEKKAERVAYDSMCREALDKRDLKGNRYSH